MKQLLTAFIIVLLFACNASQKATRGRQQKVEITTSMGTVVVKLYNETPLHRDNFIKLVKQGFYDSLMFHRVIDSFMIQGGDPNSKNALEGVALGSGSAPGDRIPAEFNHNIIHKKGALAAARDNNPQRASSNCQFYIVQGKVFNDTSLNRVECERVRKSDSSFSYTREQRNIYKTIGGTPHLDQNYTVFGEVISGLEVIDKIAKVKRDARNRPLQDVRMRMRLIR